MDFAPSHADVFFEPCGLLLCQLIGPQHHRLCPLVVVYTSLSSFVHRWLCCAISTTPSIYTWSSSCCWGLFCRHWALPYFVLVRLASSLGLLAYRFEASTSALLLLRLAQPLLSVPTLLYSYTSGTGNTDTCFCPWRVANFCKPDTRLNSGSLTSSTSTSTLSFDRI
jgi:hypothetical protein